MKKSLHIFTVIIMIFMITNVFFINRSYAAMGTIQPGGGTTDVERQPPKKPSTTSIDPDKYKPGNILEDGEKKVLDKVGVILGAVRNISVVVSVIALMIIGFKYILGSVEEKANYKATLFPYVIGFIVAITGTTLVDFIYNMLN